MTKASVTKAVRLSHLYFGVFISPAILFFALTGALQTFDLHEPNRAGTYQPPKWLAVLGHLHKKADASVPQRRDGGGGPRPDGGGKPGGGAEEHRAPGAEAVSARSGAEASVAHQHGDRTGGGERSVQATVQPAPAGEGRGPAPSGPVTKKHNTLPMKIFFVIVSLGLFVLTGTGIFMSYTYNRDKRLVTLALVAGVVVPLLLLLF